VTIAVFEALNPENTIGIIRVYVGDNVVEPDPYKFFTVAMIDGNVATLKGLIECGINWADVKAMGAVLKHLGVAKMTWTHNGKQTIYRIK